MFEEFSHPDTLKRPMLKWLLLFLTIILIAAVLISVFQYKRQNNEISQNQGVEQKIPYNPANPLQEVEVEAIIAQGHSLSAKIEAIDQKENTLLFSTKIFDLSHYAKSDKVTPRELPIIEKTYRVRITDKTAFNGKPSADLRAGDVIIVQTKESIYETETPTAQSVKFWDEQKEQLGSILGDTDVLFGMVNDEKKINGAMTLAVEAEIPDKEKLATMDLSGSYEVPYMKKTFSVMVQGPALPEESMLGKLVRITVTENIYESTALKASDILLIR